jgi:hypothetical protein
LRVAPIGLRAAVAHAQSAHQRRRHDSHLMAYCLDRIGHRKRFRTRFDNHATAGAFFEVRADPIGPDPSLLDDLPVWAPNAYLGFPSA